MTSIFSKVIAATWGVIVLSGASSAVSQPLSTPAAIISNQCTAVQHDDCTAAVLAQLQRTRFSTKPGSVLNNVLSGLDDASDKVVTEGKIEQLSAELDQVVDLVNDPERSGNLTDALKATIVQSIETQQRDLSSQLKLSRDVRNLIGLYEVAFDVKQRACEIPSSDSVAVSDNTCLLTYPDLRAVLETLVSRNNFDVSVFFEQPIVQDGVFRKTVNTVLFTLKKDIKNYLVDGRNAIGEFFGTLYKKRDALQQSIADLTQIQNKLALVEKNPPSSASIQASFLVSENLLRLPSGEAEENLISKAVENIYQIKRKMASGGPLRTSFSNLNLSNLDRQLALIASSDNDDDGDSGGGASGGGGNGGGGNGGGDNGGDNGGGGGGNGGGDNGGDNGGGGNGGDNGGDIGGGGGSDPSGPPGVVLPAGRDAYVPILSASAGDDGSSSSNGGLPNVPSDN